MEQEEITNSEEQNEGGETEGLSISSEESKEENNTEEEKVDEKADEEVAPETYDFTNVTKDTDIELDKELTDKFSATAKQMNLSSGEEFTIILPETAALNAITIAERLRKKISEIEVKIDENTVLSPTVSIGIAEYPNVEGGIKELIDAADKALYASKENGKNCIHLFFDGQFTKYIP